MSGWSPPAVHAPAHNRTEGMTTTTNERVRAGPRGRCLFASLHTTPSHRPVPPCPRVTLTAHTASIVVSVGVPSVISLRRSTYSSGRPEKSIFGSRAVHDRLRG
eukprot:4032508-Prymnesium_polylepis.1